MVRLCLAGGGLSGEPDRRFEQAARLYAQSDYRGAAALYHEILSTSPQHPDALNMLGLIAQRAQKLPLALALFEAALTVKPDFALARYNRSVILRATGRVEEALQSARMAVDAFPGLAEAWDMIGQILKDRGDFAEATKAMAHALVLQPENASFYDHYALLLYSQGDLTEAYRAARLAADLDPNYAPMLLGNILAAMGYPQLAAEAFARVRALRPDFADAAASEAMARLQIGDMARGWPLWEQRPDLEAAMHFLPLWRGQKLDHLLVYEDQGLGDAIQFLRYLPWVKERVKHLTLRIRAPLRRLCVENFPGIEIITTEDVPAGIEARCRLASLPALFAPERTTLPPCPYLTASPDKEKLWREQIRKFPMPRIGLVWAGNPEFHHDRERSLALKTLQPLIDLGAEHFISLQKNHEDALNGLFDGAALCEDFADTAAAINTLDLVIAVDTASAHLAGALGKPVWVLLPFSADWRWLLGREDSPWYGTARLFRQKKRGDWGEVIERVTSEIKKLIAGDLSVLEPPVWQGECLRQHPNALSLPS